MQLHAHSPATSVRFNTGRSRLLTVNINDISVITCIISDKLGFVNTLINIELSVFFQYLERLLKQGMGAELIKTHPRKLRRLLNNLTVKAAGVVTSEADCYCFVIRLVIFIGLYSLIIAVFSVQIIGYRLFFVCHFQNLLNCNTVCSYYIT